mmetsp:Transcript_46781/g.77476  ORF Transcript_46781/g.77476 Transcript_46781/m.77476 type:complete len:138 (-) Transcript_46781:366-779(-)|eukprot:CAMPEP_0119321672 /NCGR_PEP_ID=MMETSP1333-20130426/56085_1 /TAXON_ID=418940 /ORGANISM="Scyphosphaera apsteinii, Strain RCC1455" /LENGTH=137 /DNA_ID=CAMNT_0007328689 /DNA_START=61 /DNA_END=474 /DNA_ORIENTATION=+
MDCANGAEVIERMREQAGAFEHMQDRTDDRVNDGNNYRGLMNVKDYKKKREEVSLSAEERKSREEAAARSRLLADRSAKSKAEAAREAREKIKREKLQRELAEAQEPGEEQLANVAKKRKKKSAATSTLSFDAEEEV